MGNRAEITIFATESIERTMNDLQDLKDRILMLEDQVYHLCKFTLQLQKIALTVIVFFVLGLLSQLLIYILQ